MDFNKEIINKAVESEVAETEKHASTSTYNIKLTIKARSLNIATIAKLLNGNGNEVVDIIEEVPPKDTVTAKKAPIFKSNIGKRVAVAQDTVVANNVVIKTSTNLFKIAQVVLPVGTVGIVADVKDKLYVVDFDASLPIRASDIIDGGYTSSLTYKLDKFGLDNKQIEFF